ncbi:hypothetical protein [Streptomyces sp. NPDC057694]|uniref:hypothetical protein n=1 Tax=Streptomyces sp. NPDC057694 TaxID=3346216 RepID=UPI0036CF5C30
MATPARAFGDEALSVFELDSLGSAERLRLPLGKAWNVRFEEVQSVRPFRWAKGGQSFAGCYWAVTTLVQWVEDHLLPHRFVAAHGYRFYDVLFLEETVRLPPPPRNPVKP